MESEDEIYERILRSLEIDHQFFIHLDAAEIDRIKQIRALCRKAARELGWKIRTFQTDPRNRADTKVVVGAAIIESTPEEEQRMTERGELIMRNIDIFGKDD